MQALFEHSGVIRVQNVTQMFDTAQLLAYQPLPAGGRVAVVGNSTALNLLVVDALHGEGLEVAGQPVDAGTDREPRPTSRRPSARRVGPTDVDALVVVFVPPLEMSGTAHAEALREAVAGLGKPVVTTFLASSGRARRAGRPRSGRCAGARVGAQLPDARAGRRRARAGRALRPLAQHTGRRERAARRDRRAGRAGAGRAAPRASTCSTTTSGSPCCAATASRCCRSGGSRSAADAVAAARELGFPVAIKATAEQWRHRVDGAGVRLMVITHQGARQAFADLSQASGRDEVFVQKMGPPGTSCAFALLDDPTFGSLLSFGLSGMATELLGDRAYRLIPLYTVDAAELVREPRAAPLLSGYRGESPAKLDALEDLALRLNRLADDLPEVRSLVLDPVLAGPDGVAVSGSRIVLGPPPTREEAGPRRLG